MTRSTKELQKLVDVSEDNTFIEVTMHEMRLMRENGIYKQRQEDKVNHPKHYKSHPSGVECITVTEHMNFNRGNAIKYIWRAGEKSSEIQDLEKAAWYINREIERVKKCNTDQNHTPSKGSNLDKTV